MKARKKYEYRPDYAVPPGQTLREVMESLEMTQKEFAIRTGLTVQSLNRIFKGEQPISYESANRLELATGTPASFWNNLEAQYQEQKAKVEEAGAWKKISNGSKQSRQENYRIEAFCPGQMTRWFCYGRLWPSMPSEAWMHGVRYGRDPQSPQDDLSVSNRSLVQLPPGFAKGRSRHTRRRARRSTGCLSLRH
jgi:addiction module HigA family antidote